MKAATCASLAKQRIMSRKPIMNTDSSERPRPSFMGPADPVEYDAWFRAKVQEALDDPRPSIPHEEAMQYVRDRIRAHAQGPDPAPTLP